MSGQVSVNPKFIGWSREKAGILKVVKLLKPSIKVIL